jgi:hypothetical protein
VKVGQIINHAAIRRDSEIHCAEDGYFRPSPLRGPPAQEQRVIVKFTVKGARKSMRRVTLSATTGAVRLRDS